jgi:hypothetical protein
MSLAAQHRRLQRLEKANGPKGPTLEEVVMEVERPYAAARSVTAFARALAGTDKLPAPARLPPMDAGATESAPHALEPAKHAGVRRLRWPDHDEVLTWDEAMRLGWHDPLAQETAAMMQRLSDDAASARDPWANWGAIGPPSYAKESEADGADLPTEA